MSPRNPPPFLLLLLISLIIFIPIPAISSPLPTIAISHFSNQTLICALLPSHADKPYDLNCTSLPSRRSRSYPSGAALYSAIAAGDGFLCALGSHSSNVSTMRWWDFADAHGSVPDAKRVYKGPPLAALASGGSHVCALGGGGGGIQCWRWPQLALPRGLNFTGVAVGGDVDYGDFVCGLLDSGAIRCFGGGAGVVGNEPGGNYTAVAAGPRHACGISADDALVCWGAGAPEMVGNPSPISSVALGDNRTCALDTNGRLQCWGDDFVLSKDLMDSEFIAIEAKGRAFCGVLNSNFSLVCWGDEIFHQNPVVFNRVLPASCSAVSACPCGVLPDSGYICVNGGICLPCKLVNNAGPTASPTNSPTNSTATDQKSGANKRRVIFIAVGSVGLAVGLAAVSCLLFVWYGKRSGRVHDSGRLAVVAPLPDLPTVRVRQRAEEGAEPPLDRRLSALLRRGPSSTVEEFSLQFLLDVTDSFSEGCKIGSGSFGSVYRATLDDGRVVAIKRAEPFAASSSHAAAAEDRRRDRERAFVSELALLSRVHHKNLVRLLGYCKDGAERILVYEFMTNGTLHDHLHKLPGTPLASWCARLRAALDAARGVEYLHVYAVPPIIHRDIKSSNILLDEAWTAKVSDFGLSLMSPDGGGGSPHLSLRAAGTVGYMDPEYYRLQHLTAKSDVYSFGVVLLELLTGCRAVHRYEESGTPRNVVEFAVPHIEADSVHQVLDRRLPPPAPSEIEAVAYVGYLAADCVCAEGRKRPTMSEIVGGLDRALAACLASKPLTRSTTTRSM